MGLKCSLSTNWVRWLASASVNFKIWFNQSEYLFLIFWPIRSLLTLIYLNPNSKCAFLEYFQPTRWFLGYFLLCVLFQCKLMVVTIISCFFDPLLWERPPALVVSCFLVWLWAMMAHACVLRSIPVLYLPHCHCCAFQKVTGTPQALLQNWVITSQCAGAVKHPAMWRGNIWSYFFHLLVRCH